MSSSVFHSDCGNVFLPDGGKKIRSSCHQIWPLTLVVWKPKPVAILPLEFPLTSLEGWKITLSSWHFNKMRNQSQLGLQYGEIATLFNFVTHSDFLNFCSGISSLIWYSMRCLWGGGKGDVKGIRCHKHTCARGRGQTGIDTTTWTQIATTTNTVMKHVRPHHTAAWHFGSTE